MIFLLPLRWLGAVLIAAIMHELGHYCAVYLLGGEVHSFRVNVSGAVMQASGLNQFSEIICLLAGPLAGLLPLLVFRGFPVLAICGAIQSAYNLLPIYPLDGGKILREIILIAGGSERCFKIIEYFTITLLSIACIYIHFRYRISLFLLVASCVFRKTPCKPQRDWI